MSLSAQDKLVLYFNFNQNIINEKSQEDFCKWLDRYKGIEIIKIQGYCDSVDSNLYNKELSFRRAHNVLALLEFNKISISANLELNGLGEEFQQSKNQSDNRKVVVYYQDNKAITKKKENENLVFQNSKMKEIQVNKTRDIIPLIERVNLAKVGDLIKLENLNFYFNSEKIIKESEPILSDLLQVLKMNPQLKINIYGYICCNSNPNDVKLSYRRSKMVFDYLIRNGISTARLGHRGFGSSRPIYPLPEKNEAERIANRRVEILVIKK
jgi:outer membrane protein OmpA-like peptidoglycan-associated protein